MASNMISEAEHTGHRSRFGSGHRQWPDPRDEAYVKRVNRAYHGTMRTGAVCSHGTRWFKSCVKCDTQEAALMMIHKALGNNLAEYVIDVELVGKLMRESEGRTSGIIMPARIVSASFAAPTADQLRLE